MMILTIDCEIASLEYTFANQLTEDNELLAQTLSKIYTVTEDQV